MDPEGESHIFSKTSCILDNKKIINTKAVRSKETKVRESTANTATYRCMSFQSCR